MINNQMNNKKRGYPINVPALSHMIESFLHRIEHGLFDARYTHDKILAASRMSFLYKFLLHLSSAEQL